MSSTSLLDVLGSAVFRRVILSSAALIAVAVAVLWLIGVLMLAQIERQQWDSLWSAAWWFETTLSEDGLQSVLDDLAVDGEPIWDDDYIYELLEEETPVYAIYSAEDDVIAGYKGLRVDEGQDLVTLRHPEIEDELRAISFDLPDGRYGFAAAFFLEREWYLRWVMVNGTYALLIIGLPLALVIGYLLSLSVFRRITALSDTAAAVADGQMSIRAPISDRRDEFDRLASGMNHMLDQVQALTSNIEAVSVGVAHDLKTPLANIGGRLELMRVDADKPEAMDRHIGMAEGYLAEVLRIFDAILRLGEIESGKRRQAFARIDFSAWITDMSDAYQALFEDAQKTLSVKVVPGIWIEGDRELLDQLLSNLLENALEHSRDAAKVFVEVTNNQDVVRLTVGDDGPGISPGDQTRIFDRFYRADSSRTTPGSGLGLSLVKAISDLHQAKLSLDPVAKGAVFHIDFPKAPQS
jgi:signal transduction histidine kinase